MHFRGSAQSSSSAGGDALVLQLCPAGGDLVAAPRGRYRVWAHLPEGWCPVVSGKEDPTLWTTLASPEAAAAVITLVGALLAAYWGGRAGGRGAVAAAQVQNRGLADQAATDARRAVYAEFARDARALADGVHRYVMEPGPDLDADTEAYDAVLVRARWSYEVVSIEGPKSVRDAAKLFISQAIACRNKGSWHSAAVAAFSRLEGLKLAGDGHRFDAAVAVERELEQVRGAARVLPQEWRARAQVWASDDSTNAERRARWQEDHHSSPDETPAYEDVAKLVDLLSDDGAPTALSTAVQAGYLTSMDASKLTAYAVTWAESDTRQRVLRQLVPMHEALDKFVREASRVLHPEEAEEDS